jgi:hypothetical protein
MRTEDIAIIEQALKEWRGTKGVKAFENAMLNNNLDPINTAYAAEDECAPVFEALDRLKTPSVEQEQDDVKFLDRMLDKEQKVLTEHLSHAVAASRRQKLILDIHEIDGIRSRLTNLFQQKP